MLTFLMMIVLIGLATAVAVSAHNSLLTGRMALEDKQAFYIAEAGLQRARQALSAGTWAVASGSGNSYTESFGAGQYVVTLLDTAATTTANGSTTYTITSQGYIPSQAAYRARRQVHEYKSNVTVSSTNQSLTATASASSVSGGNTANKANDGSNSTNWKSNVNGPGSWLQMDYGSAVALDQIIAYENSNVTGVTSVQWSDDGSTWTSVSSLSVTQPVSKEWHCDFTSTSHRYVRVTFNTDSSKKVAIDELASYGSGARTVTFGAAGKVTTEW